MSVKKRPNGRWRARYRDEAGKEYARHFTTQKEALAWEAQQRSSVARGTHLAPVASKKTLREYYEQDYLPVQAFASNSLKQIGQALNACPFVDHRISKITRRHAEQWVASMKTQYKLSTYTGYYSQIRAIMSHATRHEVIPKNPLAGVKLVTASTPEVRDPIPTTVQVDTLLRNMHQIAYYFFAIAAFTGLRLGEILGLQKNDLDAEHQILRVRRQVQFPKGRPYEVKLPKYGSVRDVFLPVELVELIQQLIAEVPETTMGWLFPSPIPGRPTSSSTPQRWLRAAVVKAGMSGTKISPHAFRHFYASCLIAAGCDVVTVQRSLGHKNPSMTLDVYSHLWETGEEKVRSSVGAVMQSAGVRTLSATEAA